MFRANRAGGRTRRPEKAQRHRRLATETLESRVVMSADAVLDWNAVALAAVANDHTPTIVASAEQGGPTRTARALAIVHVAIYDALNGVEKSGDPYLVARRAPRGASGDAAVAQAAHDVLSALYTQQTSQFDSALTDALAAIPDSQAETDGVVYGAMVARKILAKREHDGSNVMKMHVSSDLPGRHRPDPEHPDQGLLTPKWGGVKPFAMSNGKQFRAPAPPRLTSENYAEAFNEVKRLGGDGVTTPSERTAEQTTIAKFWGYDGSPELGTPPRLYNQIARVISAQEGLSEMENARLFALANMAMADAGIAAWETKYVYDFWRPILGIREADAGTGPTGLGDGNPLTEGDVDWTPLGAPGSNGAAGGNFTPPFPAYTSGHATFGAAMFQTLTRFFGTDEIAFDFMSDEFNGVTRDADGSVRPAVTRHFDSLDEAMIENAESRIYLGIHWRFDATRGMVQGTKVANWAFENYLQTIPSVVSPAPLAKLGPLPSAPPSDPVPSLPASPRTSGAAPQVALLASQIRQTMNQFLSQPTSSIPATSLRLAAPAADAVDALFAGEFALL